MKSKIINSIKTVLAGVFLCIMAVSCGNFLDAGNVKEEILEAIEIANSSPATIYITADEGSGSVIPAQIVKKRKESFDLRFVPQANWKFLNWEVIDRTTGKVIPDAVKFNDPEKTETKAMLLKADSNYQIHAKCELLPTIVSVSPANLQTCPVNTSILITFNMQMEDVSIGPSDSLFKYGSQNVSIFCGSTNMKEYFDAPSFYDSEKKVLVITPKSKELKSFIELEKKSAYIDVTISFGKNIVVKRDGVELPLSEEADNSVTIRYTTQKEENPPVEFDFFTTNNKISLAEAEAFKNQTAKQFNYDNIYEDSSEDSTRKPKLLQNRTNGTFYIYGKYYDSESGVRAVTVKEKLINSPIVGTSVISEPYTHVYLFGSEGAEFLRDTGGYTVFCIECKLDSTDGAVSVQVEISDVAGNTAPVKSFVVIKKSFVDMDFTISNAPDIENFIYDKLNAGETVSEEELKQKLRTVQIQQAGAFPSFYPVYDPGPDFVQNNYKLQYVHGDTIKTINFVNIPYDYYWEFTLDVDEIAGLEFKIVISDDIGNTSERVYKMPDENSIAYYKEASPDSTDKELVYFVSKEKDSDIESGLCIERKNNSIIPVPFNSDHMNNKFCEIEKNKTYKICPQYTDSEQAYRFYLGILENINIKFGMSSASLPKVSLKYDSKTNSPVKIEKIDELYYNSPALKVTVYIADDSWANDRYDCILLSWMMNYYSTLFDTGKTECSFIIRTEDLYTFEMSLSVYGYKDGKRSAGTDYTIPQATGSKYDNIKPHAIPYQDYLYDDQMNLINVVSNFKRNGPDSFILTVIDDQSGPALGKLRIKGTEEFYIADENNNYTVEIPIKNVVRNYWTDGTGHQNCDNRFYFDYWLYDKAGNCQNEIDYSDISIGNMAAVKTYTADSSNNTWTLESEPYSTMLAYPESFTFYKLEGDDKTGYEWEFLDTKNVAANNAIINEGYKYNVEFTADDSAATEENYLKLPEDSYIKVYGNFGDWYTVPSYFYTGEKSYEKGDIVQTHTNKSVLVQSTKPAFVHTVVTTAPYSECANWEASDWEFYNEYIGYEIMDFSTYAIQQEYIIPVEQIEQNRRFAVVVHFASGKIAVSQVFQK